MPAPLTSVLSGARRLSNRWAGSVLVVGVLLSLGFNLTRWPADLRRACALRARRQPLPPIDPSEAPLVSILVAAWNERSLIERHMESVQHLRYPRLEHIICAGGDDGTYDLACRVQSPNVRVLRQRRGEGQQQAVARCLEMATGTIVMLTDADCILDDASFESLLGPILHEGEEITTGAFRPLPEQVHDGFVVHRWAATTYRSLQAGCFVTGMTGANSALTTKALRESRALDAPVWMGMDYHLASVLLSQGHRIRFVHTSEVAMRFEARFSSFARQRSRWLGGILLHALQRRRLYDVAVVGLFYAVGLSVVLIPLLTPLLGRSAPSVWLAGLSCAVLNRVRYLHFTSRRLGIPFSASTYAASCYLVPRDLLGLAYAPFDMLVRLGTKRW